MSFRWKPAVGALALTTIISGTACGRPTDTVRVDKGEAEADTSGRKRAPRMAVRDHQGRELVIPAPGKVMVLSFASRTTADQASARCREVRVAHPDVTILEIMDLSSAPGFMANKVKGKLADRHAQLLADTKQAFAAAKKTPPADLEDRIHIVPDWEAAAFEAYGAKDAGAQVPIAVIDGDGAISSFFARTPTSAELNAAVVRARTRTRK